MSPRRSKGSRLLVGFFIVASVILYLVTGQLCVDQEVVDFQQIQTGSQLSNDVIEEVSGRDVSFVRCTSLCLANHACVKVVHNSRRQNCRLLGAKRGNVLLDEGDRVYGMVEPEEDKQRENLCFGQPESEKCYKHLEERLPWHRDVTSEHRKSICRCTSKLGPQCENAFTKTLSEVQRVSHVGAFDHDVITFNGSTYMVIAAGSVCCSSLSCLDTTCNGISKVFKFDNVARTFVSYQSLPDKRRSRSSNFFTDAGVLYVVIGVQGNDDLSSTSQNDAPSLVYRLDVTSGAFVLHQTLAAGGVSGLCMLRRRSGDLWLGLAKFWGQSGLLSAHNHPLHAFKWDPSEERFDNHATSEPVNRARFCTMLEIGDKVHFVVSTTQSLVSASTHVFELQGSSLVKVQSLDESGLGCSIRGITSFSHGGRHYVAGNCQTSTAFGKLYRWNPKTSVYELIQNDIPSASGGWKIEVFKMFGSVFLASAQTASNIVRFNTTAQRFEYYTTAPSVNDAHVYKGYSIEDRYYLTVLRRVMTTAEKGEVIVYEWK